MPDLASTKGKNFVELDLPFGYRVRRLALSPKDDQRNCPLWLDTESDWLYGGPSPPRLGHLRQLLPRHR